MVLDEEPIQPDQAIDGLVCETLSRTKTEQIERDERDQRLRNMRAIAERCAAKMPPGMSSLDHGALLYDERGLPK